MLRLSILVLFILAFSCSGNPSRGDKNETKESQPVIEKTEIINVEGDWYGLLDLGPMHLRLIFHITKSGGGFQSTLDSPDQGASGLATSATRFENGTLSIEMNDIGASFEGKLQNNRLEGTFSQAGKSFPLSLTREPIGPPFVKRRPQEPKPPFPYTSEEVSFENKSAKIKLAGTLTIPKGVTNSPAVILITGSGPQDRDEEILGHRPFFVWSDYLTRRGITVLRFDDRGVGDSGGKFKGATTLDLASDVEAAFEFLRSRDDIDSKKIGLMGHSEGGLIAPIVASTNKAVAFTILLAGTGVTGYEILKSQSKRALELDNAAEDMMVFNDEFTQVYKLIGNEKDDAQLKTKVRSFLQNMKSVPASRKYQFDEAGIAKQTEALTAPWLVNFIRIDPQDYLSKTTCPTLALNGSKDFQVLPKLNLDAIEAALKKAKNRDYEIFEFKGLNHLFQTAQSGAFEEYEQIDETIAPQVLERVEQWIHKRFIATQK